MPPRNKDQDLESEQPLQAVLLADSYYKRFMPVSVEKPKVLMPLVNVPMINYAIEFLAANGVHELFVFCTAHAQQIKEHVEQLHYPGLRLQVLISEDATSVGDAMRELDSMSKIRGDFVLMSGDVISNMDLSKVVEAHFKRRQTVPNAIMTKIFKKASPQHATRSVEDDAVLVMETATNEIVEYEQTSNKPGMSIQAERFENRTDLSFRYDLIDCHIDICGIEVIQLFTDNFDYQDMRDDFIKGILHSELAEDKLYAHVIANEYAARVHDPRVYDRVSRDILQRWTFPLVPETNMLAQKTSSPGSGVTSFTYSRGNLYKEKNVQLARTCVIGADVVLGSGTVIGDQSKISRSVLGRNCSIGQNVTLEGVHLWDNVVVQDNVSIKQAILCSHVVVRKGAVIHPGSILSFKVCIGEGFTVQPFTRLTVASLVDEDADEEDAEWVVPTNEQLKEMSWDPKHVGEGGVGRVYKSSMAVSELSVQSIGGNHPYVEVEGEADPFADDSSEEDEQYEEIPTNHFREEVQLTVRRGAEDNHALENVQLEVNSLKFAEDKSFSDCIDAFMPVIFDLADPNLALKQYIAALTKVLQHWAPFMKKFLFSRFEQESMIRTIETYALEHDKFASCFHCVLQVLYQVEVLAEDAILDWAAETESSDDEHKQKFFKQATPFVDWLKAADEEDEDEDEDAEEEDD
eukprot:GILJ01005895.1.p1 GENE.GILJ01005895.1~~GILJ01005895.1.p1  ORF type:complete len:689 (-),score=134.44 GILJ01005895.1:248-2314(-)